MTEKQSEANQISPVYLGDGVYAKFDGYHIVLMTGSHDNPDDTIYLDHRVIGSLQTYITRVKEEK